MEKFSLSEMENLAYFDFLEELKIVGGDGTIMGDFEEWVEGI